MDTSLPATILPFTVPGLTVAVLLAADNAAERGPAKAAPSLKPLPAAASRPR